MFNMSKEKWFIAVADIEEAIAVQKWLLDLGYTWSINGKNVRTDIKSWDYPYAIGYGHFGADSLGQASVIYWVKNNHLEIKVDLELKVIDVKLPVVESEQEKQIKALESTIQMAQDQIQKIKEGL